MLGFITAGLSLVSGALGYKASRDASKAASRQGAEEARLEGLVTDEQIRLSERREAAVVGETIAGAAGAGVKVQGSVMDVLADTEAEFLREREHIEEVGGSRAQTALDRGAAISRNLRYQGYGSLVSGTLGAIESAHNFGLFSTKKKGT